MKSFFERDVVRVHPSDILNAWQLTGILDAAVKTISDAAIAFVFKQDDPWIFLVFFEVLQKLRLCRSIVHNDKNKFSVRLPEDALDCLSKVVRSLVENRHDNRYLGLCLSNWLCHKVTDVNSGELIGSIKLKVDFSSQINMLIERI